MPKFVEAVGAYKATEANQLSFPKGAVMEVIKVDDKSGWYTLSYSGKQGLVSCAYFQECKNPPGGGGGGQKPPPLPSNHPSQRGAGAAAASSPGKKESQSCEIDRNFDPSDNRWNWGRISREEAVAELKKDGRDGTFIVRMSQTEDDSYSISVNQDGTVRHLRVLNKDGGFALGPDDPPTPTLGQLILEKMGIEYKSKLADGGQTQSRLLQRPLYLPEEDLADDSFLRKG
eukprot:m.60963 g.60963  ORF g.60963 m.60963 type:complete len:230 (+) comp13698_c1_seq2:180-869(+)